MQKRIVKVVLSDRFQMSDNGFPSLKFPSNRYIHVKGEKNMEEKALDLAYCGIYCPECSFKVAFETQKREHLLAMPEKYDSFKNADLEDCKCSGCKHEKIRGDCKIKDCAISKNLEHCGECDDFPCDIILNFSNDGIPHHKNAMKNLKSIRINGVEEFLKKMDEQIKCDCGERFSWYLKKCIACGKVRED